MPAPLAEAQAHLAAKATGLLAPLAGGSIDPELHHLLGNADVGLDRPADADRILYEGMILSQDPERAHVQAVFDAFPPRACDLHVPSGDQP